MKVKLTAAQGQTDICALPADIGSHGKGRGGLLQSTLLGREASVYIKLYVVIQPQLLDAWASI